MYFERFILVFFIVSSIFFNIIQVNASAPQDSVGIVLIKNKKFIKYKVEAGENINSISKKYKIPADQIVYNNGGLKNITTGQIINLPFSTSVDKKKEPSTLNNTIFDNNNTAVYEHDPLMQQVLVIPFDPYLYFSDADDEMAKASNISQNHVRQVFRKRMNALLDHPAYEMIHLVGGKAKDSISDLNKIYKSVSYKYFETPDTVEKAINHKTTKQVINKKSNVSNNPSGKATIAKDNGKYYGVVINNPAFFKYFENKYNVDYYLFINQFEVKTNYENCLDRSAHNFDRTLTTHYSIFDINGKQIGGNRFDLLYNSNTNRVYQIVAENMLKITEKILADLPKAIH